MMPAVLPAPLGPTPRTRRLEALALGASVALLVAGAWAVTGSRLVGVAALAAGAVGLVAVAWRRTRGRGPAVRRLKFTREGRYFVGLCLGVGFAAVNTGNNLLYLVLGMMLSLIIVSGILSETTLRRLEVSRDLPRQVEAGRPYLTGITLANGKRRLASFSVQVEDVPEGEPPAKKCYFLKVPPDARQSTSYRGEQRRRGVKRFAGFRMSTRFPFGFFVKSGFRAAPGELLVLPRIRPLTDLPEAARNVVGQSQRPRRGIGREFHGLRPYREGDDARDIHWKRSAREGRVMLREYETEAARRVGICLNDRVPQPPGRADEDAFADQLEDAVELAASLLAHFSARGFAVELLAGGERIPVEPDGRGLDSALRLLAVLPFRVPGAQVAPLRAPRGVDTTWVLVTHRRAAPFAEPATFAHVFEVG